MFGRLISLSIFSYLINETSKTASMSISCTADSDMFASMSLNTDMMPLESEAAVRTVSIRVTCSMEADTWEYKAIVGEDVYTVVVKSVDCMQL